MTFTFAPQEQTFVNYGEVAFVQLMQNYTWPKGSRQPVPHEKENPEHKRASNYVELKFFPFGSDNEVYSQYLQLNATEWNGTEKKAFPSKWQIFYDSLSGLVSSADNFLGNHVGKSFYASWENVKTGNYYINGEGEKKETYSKKLVALYDGMTTCYDAWLADGGGDKEKEEDEIPFDVEPPNNLADKIKVALNFVEPLARQCLESNGKVNEDKLAIEFAKLEMLNVLTVDMSEVQDVIARINKEPKL